MIPIIFAVVIGVMGLFVVINPKAATKKADRDDAAAVKKTRKLGVFYFIICGILLVMGLMTLEKEVRCTRCGQPTKVVWYTNAEKNFCDPCMKWFESIFR